MQIVCSNQEVELVCDDTLGGYEVEQKHKVYLYTYDISDRTKPELLGVVEQDGYYQSSRKKRGLCLSVHQPADFGAIQT